MIVSRGGYSLYPSFVLYWCPVQLKEQAIYRVRHYNSYTYEQPLQDSFPHYVGHHDKLLLIRNVRTCPSYLLLNDPSLRSNALLKASEIWLNKCVSLFTPGSVTTTLFSRLTLVLGLTLTY